MCVFKWLDFHVHLKIFFMIPNKMQQMMIFSLLPSGGDAYSHAWCLLLGVGTPSSEGGGQGPSLTGEFLMRSGPPAASAQGPTPLHPRGTYCLWLGGQSVDLGVVSVPSLGSCLPSRLSPRIRPVAVLFLVLICFIPLLNWFKVWTRGLLVAGSPEDMGALLS